MLHPAATQKVRTTVKGVCQSCIRHTGEVELTRSQWGNILMCAECLADEQSTADLNNKVVEDSRKKDDLIVSSVNVFNAATTSFVELEAAFKNNPSIDAKDCQKLLAAEAARRLDIMSTAILEHDKKGMEMKDEKIAWQTNLQRIVAQLQEKEREKYKPYAINYDPKKPKSVKPTTTGKTPTTKSPSGKSLPFNMTELTEVATKYGLLDNMEQIQNIRNSKKLSYEDAAKRLMEILGMEV